MSEVDWVDKFIYDMSYFIRMDLCKILNQNNKWEELGAKMQFDFDIIQSLRKEKDPTDELLTIWSQYNHTMSELFVLLSKMHHYQAMNILKPLVNPKFHYLIEKGESNLQRLNRRKPKGPKDSIDSKNFNQASPGENAQKFVPKAGNEELHKILNQSKRSVTPPLPPSNSNNLLNDPIEEASSQNAQKPLQISEVKEANLPQAMYEELTIATNNWNKRFTLGSGGFGIVYRGIWKNTDVAIKKIERRSGKSDESYAIQLKQSLKEIQILNSHPHDNILALYAYSVNGEAPCLVYQFMPNGSVEDRLMLKNKTEPLSWKQRYDIALGTARGLQYLHTIGDKPLIHGDIKTANILLDKYMDPKIGDFGLAREGPEENSMKVSKIFGTKPYVPADFISSRNLSIKIDTYSFGVVVFELATGMPPYDNRREDCIYLRDLLDKYEEKDYINLIDKKAGFSYEGFVYFIKLGKWCANKFAEHRPVMERVYKNLSDSKKLYFAPDAQNP